jgi:hypothetical protein
MSTKEGQHQDDTTNSGEPSESSLTDLLHGFQDRDQERGQARVKMSHAPVLIAALFVSVALLVGIYKIGVQGLGLRENLFRIGIEYGVPWKILLKFNDLADADAI